MIRYRLKKMYVPALIILTGVFFMLVLISVSTYRNLDRDKRKAIDALGRQGLSLFHTLEAGARAGLSTDGGERMLEALFRETARNEDIAYIYLSGGNGFAVYAASENLPLKVAPWRVSPDAALAGVTRIRKVSPDLQLYELGKRFLPEYTDDRTSRDNHGTGLSANVSSGPLIAVIGLRTTEFEKAHTADMHHAVVMAAILVALGLAALFFIFVIQNYYLVNKDLKRTQDYTRQVVANMANGLLSINMDGEVVSYNLLSLELLGLQESDVKGLDLRNVIDFDATGISETLAGCESVMDHEIGYQLKSGRTIPLSLSATPISTDQDTCSGAVILLRDLREIKRLEAKVRRSEKLAAIGELAAGVAHEIRNPLSSIKGFAQYLRHILKDRPEEQAYADVMVREVDRINRVVTDLLTYARPVAVHRAPVDLPEVVRHTVRLVTADAQAKEVAITPDISGDLNGVWLDANQITQALLNLLLNAIQAISTGGKIEIGAHLPADNRLHIWVEDNGPGIPADDQNKILDPFFTTRNKGTGLGLAIVHKIVENHRGEILIQSPRAGNKNGTRVSLYIPLNAGERRK